MKTISRNNLKFAKLISGVVCLGLSYSHSNASNAEAILSIDYVRQAPSSIEQINSGFEGRYQKKISPSNRINENAQKMIVSSASSSGNTRIKLFKFGWIGDFDTESHRLRQYIIAQFGTARALLEARSIMIGSGFICGDANSAEMRIVIPDNLTRGTISNATRPNTVILCHTTRLRFILPVSFIIYIQSQDGVTVSNVDVSITSY